MFNQYIPRTISFPFPAFYQLTREHEQGLGHTFMEKVNASDFLIILVNI